MVLCATAEPGPVQPSFVLAWGEKGDATGQFHSPIGIAINAADEIFVTEFNANRVQKFDTNGRWLAAFPVVEHPGGLAVDREGRLYVAAMNLGKIVVYDSAGKLLHEWGKVGEGEGEFKDPGGIAIAADGTVYVADQSRHRVQHFTAEGKFLNKWGEYGSAPGQFGGKGKKEQRFGGPHFLAFDHEGAIFTTEGAEGRIQKLTADGKPLLHWGSNSTGTGGFGGRETAERNKLPGPIGIVIDPEGRVWVSSTNNRVQAFTPNGKYLGGLTETGGGPGQLLLPHGMAFDSKGCFYVVDSSNQRVQKFSLTDATAK